MLLVFFSLSSIRRHTRCAVVTGVQTCALPISGGKHTEPKHFRLMLACAEICRTAAHFMLLESAHHKHVCRECAEICEECAEDCERLGDMSNCVDACRRCADSCRKMAAWAETPAGFGIGRAHV